MNKQVILCSILIIVAAWVGWQYLMPTFDKVASLREEQSVWQKKLSETQDLSKKLETLRKKYNSMITESEKIAQAIPLKEDLPGLLVQLEELTSQNGLILDNVNFSTEAADTRKTAASVKSLAVNLSLSGGQTSFKDFLKAIENNLRIMDVSSFSIKGQTSFESAVSGPGASSEGFKLSLITYFRK